MSEIEEFSEGKTPWAQEPAAIDLGTEDLPAVRECGPGPHDQLGAGVGFDPGHPDGDWTGRYVVIDLAELAVRNQVTIERMREAAYWVYRSALNNLEAGCNPLVTVRLPENPEQQARVEKLLEQLKVNQVSPECAPSLTRAAWLEEWPPPCETSEGDCF